MICALGDLLLDVVVRLDGPIAEDTDTYGRTRVAPGGQAANVTAWVATLGGRARFVGVRAHDPAGRLLAAALGALGVELAGPERETGTGTVVSLARPDGARTMLTDRGVSPSLAPDELRAEWLDGCVTLHVPAYSLVREPIGSAALRAADVARERGARVSLDLSGTAAIEELGVPAFRTLVERLAPDIVFGTEAEFARVGTLAVPTAVEKRGADGFALASPDTERVYVARPTDVVDTTGAGDALAAGFLVGGPELGLDAAARCVATMGAFPA